MIEQLQHWLIGNGFNEAMALYAANAIIALAIIIVSLLANYTVRRILLVGVTVFVKRTRTDWDDALVRRKVFARMSHLAPIIVIYYTAYLFPPMQETIQRLSMVYMIFVGLSVLLGFLNAIVDIYREYDVAKNRPIKGYVQIVQIILVIVTAILAIAIVLNQSVAYLLGGLGAMTAVLILVFKDTILGLVASVQLTSNDMVRIGDWIEMPKYGADGDVIDITLHTVKIQNWDKTISTIPAYYLISDSFRNWRGMTESGGRRIKRAVYIDQNSIKFCDPKLIEKLEKVQLLQSYLKTRREEIDQYNREHHADTSCLVNGRNLTNIGTFRAYLSAYLKAHPKIHQKLTFLIRQLQPGPNGLPLEIYVFSNDQEWANYEAIQADIFDHILAVVPEFDLRVYQNPTGADFARLTSSPRTE